MSGNFDFPPASQSNDGGNIIPPRFTNIRQALQRERDQTRESWDNAAAERARSNPRDQRDAHMPPAARSSPSHRRGPPPYRNGRRVMYFSSEGPPSALGRRPRASAREAYPSSRPRRGLTTREQLANLHPSLERRPSDTLERDSPALHDLLDPNSFPASSPFPNLESYLANGALEDYEEDESRQRLKRRKLYHSDSPSKLEYGHYGQVVAGPLKMEIVSCDGGQLRDDSRLLYRPENMLRNDRSVYCTEQSRCNLLLHHQGETLFSLEKLIIRGPDKGFSAPYVHACH
ncbi:MAG: hypothetical protein INR71_02510 [Terriglobus roseus]|nr:hypothetical protein [Terriglobus roseus]